LTKNPDFGKNKLPSVIKPFDAFQTFKVTMLGKA